MKRLFVALVLFVSVACWGHANVYSNLTWMKIRAKTKEDRTRIANVGAVIETIQYDYVTVLASPEEKLTLDRMGGVDASFPFVSQMEDFPSEDSNFHNYTELANEIVKLQTQNPDIIHPYSIGKSVEGRDIVNIMISNDVKTEANKPAIVFMGSHHAREHLSTEIPFMLAQYIATRYRAGDPDMVRLVNTRIIHIIPMVNPDGAEWDIQPGYYQMWRKNRSRNSNGSYGVDLNRNYGFGWGGAGASASPNSETYRGPAPFSEPETQAIKNFVESRSNLTTLLSFHTFSQLILYPYGHIYDSIADERDRRVHEVMAQKMSEWNGYAPQKSSELYLAAGDTADWAYGTRRIISFTFELDPGSMMEGGFYPGQSLIPAVFAKNLLPALYLIENADNPYKVLTPTHERWGLRTPLIQ